MHRVTKHASKAYLLLVAALIFTLSACSDSVSVEKITGAQLAERMSAGEEVFILDVRSPEEFSASHIPGAVNVPVNKLVDHFDKLPADKEQELVVYCHSGKRAAYAEELLVAQGFSNTKDLTGHFQTWRSDKLPIE